MLRSRILTALALAALLIAVILYSPAAITMVVFALILLIAAWEWSAFLGVALPGRVIYIVVLAGLGALTWRYALPTQHFARLMELAVCWWVIALAWIVLTPARGGAVAAAVAGALALLPTWIA